MQVGFLSFFDLFSQNKCLKLAHLAIRSVIIYDSFKAMCDAYSKIMTKIMFKSVF